VQPDFLALCSSALRPAGELRIATDWADYADHIEALLEDCADFDCGERRVHAGDRPLDRPVTKFERRGLKRGHRIWDWCYVCVK
jgi:tRNA (guanine-N7-)-methyltransferase